MTEHLEPLSNETIIHLMFILTWAYESGYGDIARETFNKVKEYSDRKDKIEELHQTLDKESICKRLDRWADVKNEFKFVDRYDDNGQRVLEFTNQKMSFTYFVNDGWEDPFWFGARHHMPLDLVGDIIEYFKQERKKQKE